MIELTEMTIEEKQTLLQNIVQDLASTAGESYVLADNEYEDESGATIRSCTVMSKYVVQLRKFENFETSVLLSAGLDGVNADKAIRFLLAKTKKLAIQHIMSNFDLSASEENRRLFALLSTEQQDRYKGFGEFAVWLALFARNELTSYFQSLLNPTAKDG